MVPVCHKMITYKKNDMSLRDKQIQKDIQNKYAQAREEYSKNKPLYSQTKLKEKGEGHISHPDMESKEERLKTGLNKTGEEQQPENETSGREKQ